MKIIVAMPTRAKRDPVVLEGLYYLAKLRHPASAKPVFTDPKKKFTQSQAEARIKAEGADLLVATKGYFCIAMAEGGQSFSSKDFSTYLENLATHQQKVAFIVGGACGLSDELSKTCQKTISLSPMTLPHRLAFMLLCEQIYRAHEIIRGTPYHKY